MIYELIVSIDETGRHRKMLGRSIEECAKSFVGMIGVTFVSILPYRGWGQTEDRVFEITDRLGAAMALPQGPNNYWSGNYASDVLYLTEYITELEVSIRAANDLRKQPIGQHKGE